MLERVHYRNCGNSITATKLQNKEKSWAWSYIMHWDTTRTLHERENTRNGSTSEANNIQSSRERVQAPDIMETVATTFERERGRKKAQHGVKLRTGRLCALS